MPSAARARVPSGEPGWEQEHLLQIPWKMGLDTPNAAVWGKAPARQCQGSPIPARREALPVPVLLLDLDHEHWEHFRSHFSEFPKLSCCGKPSQSPRKFRKRTKIKSATPAVREEGTDCLASTQAPVWNSAGSGLDLEQNPGKLEETLL